VQKGYTSLTDKYYTYGAFQYLFDNYLLSVVSQNQIWSGRHIMGLTPVACKTIIVHYKIFHICYESLNANLRLILLTQVSK